MDRPSGCEYQLERKGAAKPDTLRVGRRRRLRGREIGERRVAFHAAFPFQGKTARADQDA